MGKNKTLIILSIIVLLQSAGITLGADCNTITDSTVCNNDPNCYMNDGALPPFTSKCEDIPADCTQITFYQGCKKKSGCTWDVTGDHPKCVAGTTDCSIFSYTACWGDCHWDPDPSPGVCKSGSSDPSKCIIPDKTTCEATTGCRWNTHVSGNSGFCEKATPIDCTKITDITICINTPTCYMTEGDPNPLHFDPGKCEAVSTTPTDCTILRNPTQCMKTKDCTWDNSHLKCIAGTTDCSLFTITACQGAASVVCYWDTNPSPGACKPINEGTSTGTGTYKVTGGYITAKCSCTCQGKNLQATAFYQKGGNPDASEGHLALQRCQEQCARSCGGLSTCSSDDKTVCSSCCQTHCSGGILAFPCIESCSGACSYMGLVNGTVGIIYSAAGILAALMIVFFGIRIVTSQDPGDRESAKRSIMYVIIALVIIILAATLVGLFLKPATP